MDEDLLLLQGAAFRSKYARTYQRHTDAHKRNDLALYSDAFASDKFLYPYILTTISS